MKNLFSFTSPSLLFVFLLMGIVVPQIVTSAAAGSSPAKQTPTTAKQPVPGNNTVPTIPSVNADQVAARRRHIQTEKDAIQKLQSEVKATKKNRDQQLAGLQNAAVTDTTLEQARLATESIRVNIQSLLLDINHVRQQSENLQTALVDLQHRIDSSAGKQEQHIAALQQQMLHIKSLLELDHTYAGLLATHLGLLQQKADLAASWFQSVQAVYTKQQQLRQQESLEDMKRRLQEQEKKAQAQSLQIQQKLAMLKGNDPATAARRELLQKQLESLNESLNILKTKVTIQAMKNNYEGLNLNQPTNSSADILQADIKTLQKMTAQLTPLIRLTSGRLTVFQQQWALLQKQYALKNISEDLFTGEKKILTALINRYTALSTELQSFLSQLQQNEEKLKKAYNKSIQRSLTAREPLPNNLATWKKLPAELTALPVQLQEILQKSIRELYSGWNQAPPVRKMGFVAGIFILLIFSMTLGRCTRGKCEKTREQKNIAAKFKIILLSLLRGSRIAIVAGGSIVLAGWIFQVDHTVFHFFLLTVAIWLTLRLAIKISYWIFISPLVPSESRQPRLYRLVVHGAIASAFFSFLVGLGNIGIFSLQLRAVIDRLFMVLLLLLVYFFIRLRAILLSSLSLEKRNNFWWRLVALASFSIPLTALSAALVGLAGYVNLAWFVAGQLALFLIVILCWTVLHDLVGVLLDNWKQKLAAGWHSHDVPAAVVMVSIKRVIDLFLFLSALWLLARLYGWGTGTAVSQFLKTWLNHPIFHFGTQEVNLINLLTSLFVFLFFFYLSSLARHSTYAWLYKNIRDRGLRNSLSVFTQYAFLVIGALISLNFIGINLTSLTVFAGALGVGIGFGLQNIANNLISGLILLAERPVRVEDWVSVGDSQGIISRIGLRSLVLTTWDNQDVIIPNARLITQPVTNWTLSNTLIRTVLFVGVRYQDDPHLAKKVILEAVAMVPEVSLEKKPQVFLTEFADSSVNFRVHFFSDLTDQHARFAVKSKVMFAIWDALKEADIGIPFPQRDIYIKEMPPGNNPETEVPAGKQTPPAAATIDNG